MKIKDKVFLTAAWQTQMNVHVTRSRVTNASTHPGQFSGSMPAVHSFPILAFFLLCRPHTHTHKTQFHGCIVRVTRCISIRQFLLVYIVFDEHFLYSSHIMHTTATLMSLHCPKSNEVTVIPWTMVLCQIHYFGFAQQKLVQLMMHLCYFWGNINPPLFPAA